MVPTLHDRTEIYRKTALAQFLKEVCSTLEISESRRDQAEARYLGVANWLADSEHWLLRSLTIYLQGSTALGTTVRPLESDEHDVDLVAFVSGGGRHHAPGDVADLIGHRLRENGHYADLLTQKNRCWRLTYANLFHLDITPAIPDLIPGGAELVPDKSLTRWKETNPKGYRSFFEACATLIPRLRTMKAFDEAQVFRADSIEPFPASTETRSLLCRIVQLEKRHRDVDFDGRCGEVPPISVILTTLAAWSYERCVRTQVFDTEYDFIKAVVGGMPDFIQRVLPDGRKGWYIPNPSTRFENFAEKWNEDHGRAVSFFGWHARLVCDLEELGTLEGVDVVRSRMREIFGNWPVDRAFTAWNERVSTARGDGSLRVSGQVGLATAAAATRSVPVPANRFFGRFR